MTLSRDNLVYQARLNVAGCECGLERIEKTRQAAGDTESLAANLESIMKALVAIHGLAEAAINAIACFSECCYLTGRDHIATSFQSIRIDYKGFGFDFSVEELDWRHDGDVVTEADLKALNDMLRNKLSQYELILTRMRDKYADAADGLEA